MADPCVCEDNLEVTDTGELCAISGSVGLREIVIFTSSGTFTKATYPWLARVLVTVVGGGGGGGGHATSTSDQVAAGAGGGGGGAAVALIDAAGLGANETVTVGAGGTATSGANGGAGGSSSFGALVVATGGDGGEFGVATGAAFNATNVTAGGVGTTGDILHQGGDGEPGIARGPALVNFAIAGAGGTSLQAGRSRENIFTFGGTMPANSGQGGPGASAGFSTTAAAAGAVGGSGIVIVELYA